MADTVDHRPEARVRQGQPVDHRVRKPRGLRVRDVDRVRRLDFRGVLFEPVGDRQQRGVLLFGREFREFGRSRPGTDGHVVNVICNVHKPIIL